MDKRRETYVMPFYWLLHCMYVLEYVHSIKEMKIETKND